MFLYFHDGYMSLFGFGVEATILVDTTCGDPLNLIVLAWRHPKESVVLYACVISVIGDHNHPVRGLYCSGGHTCMVDFPTFSRGFAFSEVHHYSEKNLNPLFYYMSHLLAAY